MEIEKRLENALKISKGIRNGKLEPNNIYDLQLHLSEALYQAEKLKPISKNALLGDLNVGDRFKYQLDDIGIFEITSKTDKNWIDTIRVQSNRKSGDFPETKIYPI